MLRIRVARKVAAIVVVGLLVSVTLMTTEIGQRAVEHFQHRVLDLTLERGHDAGRGLLFRQAVDIGAEHPVLGIGVGGYWYETGARYPHNWFLELFAEGGGIALLLGLLMIALIAGGIWRCRRCLDPGVVGALVVFFLFAQFSGDLFDARGLFLVAILAMLPRYQALPEHDFQTLRYVAPA